MGLLIDGKWSTAWYDTAKTDGRFVRETAYFRNARHDLLSGKNRSG